MRPAKDTCPPAAARPAVGRHFLRALRESIGAALLISMVPLQGHAQNAASPVPNELTEARSGDCAPIVNAGQQCLSALAYVLSPPPATRGVLPRYLPTISPRDAQPIPKVAATTPQPRSAWRQAGRVRHSQGHQCRRRQGAQRLLAELPHPFHAHRAGSCRQERSARRLRFHRHRLCPGRCGGHPGAIAPRRHPQDRKRHSP